MKKVNVIIKTTLILVVILFSMACKSADKNVDKVIVPDGYDATEYDGEIVGITKKYSEVDAEWKAEGYVELTKDQAIQKVAEMLNKTCMHYSSQDKKRFQIEASGPDEYFDPAVEQSPVWYVTIKEYTPSGIRRGYYDGSIGMSGDVEALYFGISSNISDEELDKQKYMAKENAIAKAKQAVEEKYGAIDDDIYEVKVAERYERGNKVSWKIIFAPKEGVVPPTDSEIDHYHEYTVTFEATNGDDLECEACA